MTRTTVDSHPAAAASAGRMLLGLGLAAGVVLCTDLVGARAGRFSVAEPSKKTDPTKGLVAWLWPSTVLALTAQGLRVWSAPRGVARSRALGLWGVAEMFAIAWTAWGARRVGAALTPTAAAIGTALAFFWRARQVDTPVGNPAATALGWVGVAQALAREVKPDGQAAPTLH